MRWRATAAAVLTAAGCAMGWAAGQGPQGAAEWSDAAIRASRRETPSPAGPAARLPVSPDVLLVTQPDGGQVLVFDHGNLELLQRFKPRQPVLAQPKATPDGHYVFVASKDGWLTQYDLRQGGVPVAEVRAGLELRDFALSADGRWVLVGNATPHSLALFDSQLNLVRTYPARTLDGKVSSPVAAVHDAAPRKSFVVSFDTLPQLWDLSYDPGAEPIFDGLVHDYRMGEGIATAGFLGARRVPLEQATTIIGFDAARRHVLATAAGTGAERQADTVDIINLDVRRRIASLPVRGSPAAQAAAPFAQRGRPLVALAVPAEGIAIVDPAGWRIAQTVSVPAAVVFVVTHPNLPHLWAGSSVPGGAGKLTLIDKDTLQVAAVLEVPGGAPGRAGFNRDGSRAWVMLEGEPGAVLVYDTRAPAQVRHVPLAARAASLQCPGERCTVARPEPPDPGTPR